MENDIESVAETFDDIEDLAKVNDVKAHEQVSDQVHKHVYDKVNEMEMETEAEDIAKFPTILIMHMNRCL